MDGLGRRDFLHLAALGGTAAAMPPWLRAAVSAAERDPWVSAAGSRISRAARPNDPVRVRGFVQADGRGLPGVSVSDGLTVTRTDADGGFELTTAHGASFVFLTVPAGMRIPQNPTGTARFYEPIAPDGRGEQSVRFHLSRAERDDSRHAALLLADVQTEDEEEMGLFHAQTVPDVRETARAMGDVPSFGLACGDIMYDELWLYPEYERGVAATGIPFFQVIGNHDLDFEARSDEASANTFSRHFGPTYYSFERGSVHYVVLDDVFWHGAGYLGYID
ncbi:MAG: metallophosphoesterase N-terminal domain-containing protein, partial [Gemmatimonadota bacterium]